MRIDLHTHSDRSDGTTTPAQVVEDAAAAGLDVVALTDHDSTRGWDDAARSAQRVGIDLVRGIEITCRRGGISIHLLAYLPEPGGELFEELEHARRSRVTRAERMVSRLAEDVPITYEQVLAQAGPGATIGRPHIADALVANGVVPDRSAAFAHLLRNDGPYHVGHYAIDPVRAVTLVRDAGGVPVMAHPFAAARGRVVADAVVEEMIDAGLCGLEAHHRDHTPDQVRHALDLARAHDLVVTGSSDYHGAGKPNLLGENTTDPEQYERILALATSDVALVRGH